MLGFFSLVFLVSLLGIVVAIISPCFVSKLIRRQIGRKGAVLLFVGIAFVSVVGVSIAAPSTAPQNENKVLNTEVVSTTSTANNQLANAQVLTTSTVPKENLAIPTIASSSVSENTTIQNTQTNIVKEKISYVVSHVVDGDTIDVLIAGKTTRIRFIGMDTPETVDPRKPVQCFGKEASAKMASLVSGKSVVLKADPSQGDVDKYGRLLRYVFLQNGENVALTMISTGYAHEYTYNLPYKYQAEFKTAEQAARTAQLGLWSINTCSGDTTQAAQTSNTQKTAPVSTPTTPSAPTGSQATTSDGPQVKLSTTGICHEKGSTYYNKTTNYTAYNTIQECLAAGGRLPK